jgi:starch synthase
MKEILILSPMVINVIPKTGLQDQIRETLIAFYKYYPKDYHFTVAQISPIYDTESVSDTKLKPLIDANFLTILEPIPQKLPYSHGHNDLIMIVPESTQCVACVMNYYAMANKKPDMIHCFDWNTGYQANTLSLYYSIPYIFTCSLSMKKCIENLEDDFKKKNQTWNKDVITKLSIELEHYACENAKYIHHVSNAQALYFNQSYPNNKYNTKTHVIYNGISDFELYPVEKIRYSNIPSNLKKKRPKTVLYLGRLTKMKNLQALLECKFPDSMNLFIAGPKDTPDIDILNLLENKIRLGNTNIYYLGGVYNNAKRKLMSTVDFVICPSLHEPFGLVVLEALASHTVVISSCVEGMREILPQVNEYSDKNKDGYFINCGVTKESIENSLLVADSIDNKQYEMMIKQGRERVKDFTWEKCVKELSKLYM